MYEYLDPEESQRNYKKGIKIVFIKAIENPQWESNQRKVDIKLKKGDTTWCLEHHWDSSNHLILEANRYFINFDRNRFKQVNTPDKYKHLVSEKYHEAKFEQKQPKKKLIL